MKLCGKVFSINHSHSYIYHLCKDYMINDDRCPDSLITVSCEDMEREKCLAAGIMADEYVEASCIHRKVVNALVKYQTILIHSAAVAVDGEAYAFLAKSGVGKSTHIRQWKRHFGDSAIVVNGDKPMYSFLGDRLYVHGSPWRGKEGWGEKCSVPLKAFCFLERGEVNRIRPARNEEIVSRLFQQILLPTDSEELSIFMGIINHIVRTVPFHIMECTISEEAARIAYDAMSW